MCVSFPPFRCSDLGITFSCPHSITRFKTWIRKMPDVRAICLERMHALLFLCVPRISEPHARTFFCLRRTLIAGVTRAIGVRDVLLIFFCFSSWIKELLQNTTNLRGGQPAERRTEEHSNYTQRNKMKNKKKRNHFNAGREQQNQIKP